MVSAAPARLRRRQSRRRPRLLLSCDATLLNRGLREIACRIHIGQLGDAAELVGGDEAAFVLRDPVEARPLEHRQRHDGVSGDLAAAREPEHAVFATPLAAGAIRQADPAHLEQQPHRRARLRPEQAERLLLGGDDRELGMRQVLGEVLAREQGELVERQLPGRPGGDGEDGRFTSRLVTRSSRRASSSPSSRPRNVSAPGTAGARGPRAQGRERRTRPCFRPRAWRASRRDPPRRAHRGAVRRQAAATSCTRGNRRTSPTWNGSATASGR